MSGIVILQVHSRPALRARVIQPSAFDGGLSAIGCQFAAFGFLKKTSGWLSLPPDSWSQTAA